MMVILQVEVSLMVILQVEVSLMVILQVEVYGILFVKEQDSKFVVHCQDCARKIHCKLEGFVALNQYKIEELVASYDNFSLHPSHKQLAAF